MENKIIGDSKMVREDNSLVIGFDNKGTAFSGYHKAVKRLTDNGYSSGSMQGNEKIGIVKGKVAISKWRNLSKSDIKKLDGYMRGDYRDGKTYVKILQRYTD